ncbi:serine hydrolase domain-containing protein [Clostridium sp. BJN0001]|uniref:serine hydrolase domain-containing protein n=1 Tax=Clostridium sp. BJN0001 TaxID=2930219 RepID=UPI001FD027B6|nr:serine hydrolase domain-containing protein [Clostridium sp. BJN0001]
MKRKIIALIIAGFFASGMSSSAVYASEKTYTGLENQISQSNTYEKFDSEIKDLAKDFNDKYSTSLQYALYDGGNIIISNDAGVFSKNSLGKKDIDSNTMYGIGSVSKMFVTASVMKLMQDGKVNLDNPVTDYIKDFQMKDERYKKITVRMLLNHSSGLMGGTLYNALLYGDNDQSSYNSFLSELKNQRLKADPGEFSVYCNDGFTLAQILVERVSGMKFNKYVKENFSDNLNLLNTKMPDDNFDRENLAKIYLGNSDDDLPDDNLNMSAAGGIYSTAEDLCRFSKIFMNENKVLTDDTLNKMENEECLNGAWPKSSDDNILSYGLGWDSVKFNPFNEYGIKALCKGGDTYHYHAGFIVLPDNNISCAVLSSGSSSTTDEMLASTIILKYLKEKGTISEIKEEKDFTSSDAVSIPSEMQSYKGLYNLNTTNCNVDIEDNKLVITCPSVPGLKYSYNYTSDGYFTSEDGNEKIKFVKEKNGETYVESITDQDCGNIGRLKLDQYSMQKVDENNISDDVKNAWLKRSSKSYFLVNEKYDSENYVRLLNKTSLPYNDALKGYTVGHKIIDKDNAVSIAKIPFILGRDQADYNFYMDHSLEYLSSNSYLYVSSNGIYNLSQYLDSVTINDNGYTKYFNVPQKLEGKELTVETPENSSFFLYDELGQCKNASYISRINTVTLHAGDTVAFSGDKDTIFKISIK